MTRYRASVATVLRWAARISAVALLLFWGAFFVEHLSQWFLLPLAQTPPWWVWVAQLFHLVMLVGLALMLKWDRLGTVILVLGTLGFVGTIGDARLLRVLWINVLPVVLFAVAWWEGAGDAPTSERSAAT